MTEQEAIEGNKLIAEFMGAKFYPEWTSDIYKSPFPTFDFEENRPAESSSRFWSPSGLEYHSSWDWLMPVVEKIEGLKFTVKIIDRACFISTYPETIIAGRRIEGTKIKAVWLAIVEFIKWYNQSKKNKP